MVIKTGVLNIKKRSLPEWLAYFIFFTPFFLALLQDFLGLPGFIRYLIDAAWVLASLILITRSRIEINRRLIPLLFVVSLFILYTIINYIFHYQSALYYLWGFRNNFRFYFAFFIFCVVFTQDDADKCLRFIDVMFWINAAVTFFQFFVLGYQQDYLGGIFGVDRGCNSSSIVFFSIVIAKSILMFMSGKEGFWLCFSKISVTLIISALAELKFFFVVFMIILILSTFLTSFAWRKVPVLLFSAALVAFSGTILTAVFGEGSTLSLERLLEIAFSDTYSGGGDLGRLTGIPTVSRTLFDDWGERLFGFGLGNCDTSTFALVNTPFYQTYGYLHYTWFSSIFMFLELGFVGLIFYMLFFVLCFIGATMQRSRVQNPLYCQLAMILSVVSFILIFYNSSLRTEAGYMFYFALSLPFIANLKSGNETM